MRLIYGYDEGSPDAGDLRIDRSERSGWPTGAEEVPAPGRRVYCTEGMAEVVKVLGRTGNGSRLLQLRLLDRKAPPFHAAASNVLVEPPLSPAAADGAAFLDCTMLPIDDPAAHPAEDEVRPAEVVLG